ncbi:hypothetical protein BP6252_12867 [Coleophoma cylindrospora]|uniref:Uncharacterized protein n=1 Tax=Coleophoma cylindrospora TaxID=1849047 RepID=A0A3D8QDP2_9HELO|nr:hypothetical protein BP6252_12867 [Coleophoma cylindrospora]
MGRTVVWSKRLRKDIEVFNRCLDACDDDMNEARLTAVEILESILQILSESVQHLQNCPTDSEASKDWKHVEDTIAEYLSEIEWAVKHVNEIINYSKANREKQASTLAMRHGLVFEPEEPGTFPIFMSSKKYPNGRNDEFYGRQEELDRINRYLDYNGSTELRTYTIYGRRGVGKTDLAMEYAARNPAGYDAIFWIECETSLSLRHSFTNMAVELNLPGADRSGHHEENQLAVLKWLKSTKKTWLLIFDNAERESVLNGYWPIGSVGAILITSRKYHNFMKDNKRRGDTIMPFDETQSWELLIKLLGKSWEDLDKRGLIKTSEEKAAKEFIKAIGGLALAIQIAAQLITDPNIGGNTIESTYDTFKEHERTLPPRVVKQRSNLVHALDALWNMTFNSLTRNGRALLSVLSLLSPDGILIDLFLPKNQKALDGKLAFCKQHPDHVDAKSQATLSSVIEPTRALRAAIDELVRAKLIKEDIRARMLWAHRVVQEAMNYHSTLDLQEYFNSASALVYEAFPKQEKGDYLSERDRCREFISHGAHLSLKFAIYDHNGADKLKGSEEFIKLLSNCAWYLYEIGDYAQCLKVVETDCIACKEDTLQYATLCNIAGAAYFELNRLNECRVNWETMYKLHAQFLPEDSLERSVSYHNMGNLESACENHEEAMVYFDRAIAIRTQAGDDATDLLALALLCKARAYYCLDNLDDAFKITARSEALFVRKSGSSEKHFLAFVHYVYGNIEWAKREWSLARQSYSQSLKIGLINGPIHPITAAAYYSIACCEFELKHPEVAKYENTELLLTFTVLTVRRKNLDKSLAIASLRSPNRDDGTMARIMWKMSVILEDDTYGTYAKEADSLRLRAELARQQLTASGESGLVFAIDENGNEDRDETEASYEALIPFFYR